MPSRSAGGCDFASAADTTDPSSVLWTANALPSALALAELPAELASRDLILQSLPTDADIIADGNEHVINVRGERFRLHFDGPVPTSPAVLLPLDRFLAVRLAALLRLSRSLAGDNPGSNPAELSKSQRVRHVLALSAIDGRQDGASYRAIGSALFDTDEISEKGWKTPRPPRPHHTSRALRSRDDAGRLSPSSPISISPPELGRSGEGWRSHHPLTSPSPFEKTLRHRDPRRPPAFGDR